MQSKMKIITHLLLNNCFAENDGELLWDGNGGRVILNKYRMPAERFGMS